MFRRTNPSLIAKLHKLRTPLSAQEQAASEDRIWQAISTTMQSDNQSQPTPLFNRARQHQLFPLALGFCSLLLIAGVLYTTQPWQHSSATAVATLASAKPKASTNPNIAVTKDGTIYRTAAGTPVRIGLLRLKNGAIEKVALNKARPLWQQLLAPTALADGSQFILKTSSEYKNDAFIETIAGSTDKLLVGGRVATTYQDHGNPLLYTTDLETVVGHSDNLPMRGISLNDVPAVTAAASDGKRWLMSLAPEQGGSSGAKLLLLDGDTITDLTTQPVIPPGSSKATAFFYGQNFQSITWNGHEWLIICSGDDWYDSAAYTYDGKDLRLLAETLSPEKNIIVSSVAFNGTYWLLGGSHYRTTNSAALLRLDQNGTITDLSSTLNPSLGDPGGISGMVWNGSVFYLAGHNRNPDMSDHSLYTYDGTTFTDLTPQLVAAGFNSIPESESWFHSPTEPTLGDMDSNEQGDIFFTTGEWEFGLIRNGKVEKVPLTVDRNNPEHIDPIDNNRITSVSHVGNAFFISGWYGLLVRVGVE